MQVIRLTSELRTCNAEFRYFKMYHLNTCLVDGPLPLQTSILKMELHILISTETLNICGFLNVVSQQL